MTPHRGFSLAEIFLSLGLLAALATLAIVHTFRISEHIGDRPADDALRQLIEEAHSTAARTGAPVFFSFNSESAAAEVHDSRGTRIGSVSLAPDGAAAEYQLRIYRILPETKTEGEAVYETEEAPVPYVTILPNGPAVPFEIHLSSPRINQVITVDPFSSSPRLFSQRSYE